MEKDCDYFMNKLFSVLKDESSLDSVKDIINPKFIDSNGNRIYHYFSEFSLKKFYKLNYNKENDDLLIKEEKFKEIVKEYKTNIPIYIELLDELECDKFAYNLKNQNPLIYSIIQKNYYIAIEYLKIYNKKNLLKENDYQEMLILLINSGDCLKEDCIHIIICNFIFLSRKRFIRI